MRHLFILTILGSLATACVTDGSAAPPATHTGDNGTPGGGGGGITVGGGGGSTPTDGGLGDGSGSATGSGGSGVTDPPDPGDEICDVTVNQYEVLCSASGDAVTCACIVDGNQQSTCTPTDPDSPCNFTDGNDNNCCGFH